MTISNVSAYSTTKLDNDDIHDVPLDPGQMKPSDVNDAFQYLMADIASYTRLGSDLASAGTLNLDSIDSLWLAVTGTTTTTAVTLTSGHVRFVRATGAWPLTASATLIIDGETAVNYTCVAGDLLMFIGYGSSVVRCWVLSRRKLTTVDNTVPRYDGTTGALQTSGIVIADTGDVTIPYSDNGAIFGPTVELERISTTPAASDQIGLIGLYGRDSGGNKTLYGYIGGVITDPTNGSEDGAVVFSGTGSGTANETARITSSSVMIGVTAAFSMASGSNAGGYIQTDGNFAFRAVGQAPAQFGRLTDDGALLLCYRQNSNVGNIAVTTTATSFNTSSDKRLKENARDFDPGQIFDGLEVVEFDWKGSGDTSHGVLAQDAQPLYPAAVTEGDGEPGAEGFRPWAVDYSKYVPLLLREVQLLRARVAQLEG